MFTLEFDRTHNVLLTRFSGMLLPDDIRNVDQAVRLLVRDHGSDHHRRRHAQAGVSTRRRERRSRPDLRFFPRVTAFVDTYRSRKAQQLSPKRYRFPGASYLPQERKHIATAPPVPQAGRRFRCHSLSGYAEADGEKAAHLPRRLVWPW